MVNEHRLSTPSNSPSVGQSSAVIDSVSGFCVLNIVSPVSTRIMLRASSFCAAMRVPFRSSFGMASAQPTKTHVLPVMSEK
jgi:hypothetical protein